MASSSIRLSARSSSSSRLLTFTLYPLIGVFATLTLFFLYDIERGIGSPSPHVLHRLRSSSSLSSSSSGDLAGDAALDSAPSLPAPVYKGKPWISDLTASRSVIYQTAYASCELHDVWTEDRSGIQEDWLWAEEIDHVNVIVVDEAGDFYFFKQRKYGLESISFATVGGFIDVEKGETGFEACRREVVEEMGMTSPVHVSSFTSSQPYDPSNDPNWVQLGRYRTASNRGGGFLTACLLKSAVKIPKEYLKQAGYEGLGTGAGVLDGEKGNADGEEQLVVKMDLTKTRETLLAGGFQEVKWTASLALALLHL
ncbi:hypothetical protein TrRE_jg11488 [Triparma retinervis]|uniref:Nudix hydrolase domain-containing protein n=1 Tax=Triparma retinervis TaxID=2557542 RepID=A0A9W6Z8S6_9STRA|nr:hypothetical protein TrRE_jg11488 [Triparma retinervis]